MVLEILSVPPSYQGYPAQDQHYIRIDLVHYRRPKVYHWDESLFHAHHINILTDERLKRWRAYSLGVAPKKFPTCYLRGEQLNLKIYSTVNVRYYKSTIQGTLITKPNLTEYLKVCKVAWHETIVRDNRIHVSELDDEFLNYAIGALDTDGLNDIDEIGQANIDNEMET